MPPYRHRQQDILEFMSAAYQPPEEDKRKIRFLYQHSGIDYRYSVIPDYTAGAEKRVFYPGTKNLEPFPSLEKRMEWFQCCATKLSATAIRNCLRGLIKKNEITHLITVSCTGLSAPGLDISILEEMKLNPSLSRTSVNFMGCYAAIHALKMANAICLADRDARVVIVCTELCTLHFQKEYDMDNITSSLLFGDGAAATLVTGNSFAAAGPEIKSFYSEVALNGKSDMAWQVSGRGFLMTLSGYIPQLIKGGITPLLEHALQALGMKKSQITHWAIHPGGKRILEAVQQELQLQPADLRHSFEVLRKYGNMSSPSVLFVLKAILRQLQPGQGNTIFTAAFGPGLTMETLILESA